MTPSTATSLTASGINEALRTGELQSTVFGMGWFWGPDSQFGSFDGVVQVRVGYAGAATPTPLYRSLGNHAEVVRVVFDPGSIGYAELLARYLDGHEPRRSMGQYRSLLFPADESQRAEAERALELRAEGARPELVPQGTPKAHFWDAEDYHQKYRLRRNTALVATLEAELGADWDQHAVATKLNASGGSGFDVSPWLERLSPAAQRTFRLG